MRFDMFPTNICIIDTVPKKKSELGKKYSSCFLKVRIKPKNIYLYTRSLIVKWIREV